MAGPKLALEAERKISEQNNAKQQEEVAYDPSAATLPPTSRRSERTISPDESTLPPSRASRQSDMSFGPGNLPSLDNTQSALPCRFGEYILHKILGRGGMGVVYLATQCNLDRQVAVKMIRSGALASKDEVNRFYAEARSAGSLDHPSIITVYHCGEHMAITSFPWTTSRERTLLNLWPKGPCRSVTL